MIFKDSIRRGAGILKRGQRCLYRSVEAVYLGSFKNDGDFALESHASCSADHGRRAGEHRGVHRHYDRYEANLVAHDRSGADRGADAAMLVKIIIGFIAACAIPSAVVAMACCKVSGECSRIEEQNGQS